VLCKTCNTKTTNPKFCSSSCAATFNNKSHPKRKAKVNLCNSCKTTSISPRNRTCQGCKDKEQDLRDNQTLSDIMYNNVHKASAFSLVRTRARASVKHLSQVCSQCGYDKHVEVCHIKPIKDFTHDTLVKEVNSPANLLLLCPNCHWEFDHP